ncbi:MAG TPA: hypothetical protein VE981_10920 [Planctomycetota bacterium]|nr:hypothetical protein [Planctomycetota bacterium]
MRNDSTLLRRPKAWVTLVLALGHLAIIVGLLASSALTPRHDRVEQVRPSILLPEPE